MSPQMKFRTSRPFTVAITAGSSLIPAVIESGSWSFSSGNRASRPRAIMLWVFPPPIAWRSSKTACWLWPARRFRAPRRNSDMPEVTWLRA